MFQCFVVVQQPLWWAGCATGDVNCSKTSVVRAGCAGSGRLATGIKFVVGLEVLERLVALLSRRAQLVLGRRYG